MASDLFLFRAYAVPLHLVLLVVLLLVATKIDVRERRIPNWLVGAGMTSALAFHTLSLQGQGIVFALTGLLVGMAILLPLYALRAMGAGDVKLMGMIGAFLGVQGVLGAALATMVAGGIFALTLATGKRMLPQLFANLRTMFFPYHSSNITGTKRNSIAPVGSVGSMPYAVAITAGTLAQLALLRY